MKHKQAASNLMGATQADIEEFCLSVVKPEPKLVPAKGPDFDFSKPMNIWMSGGRWVTIVVNQD